MRSLSGAMFDVGLMVNVMESCDPEMNNYLVKSNKVIYMRTYFTVAIHLCVSSLIKLANLF